MQSKIFEVKKINNLIYTNSSCKYLMKNSTTIKPPMIKFELYKSVFLDNKR